MRDKRGRFARERDVVFGPWDDRIWLFGRKVMPTPVTRKSFFASMVLVSDAQTRAAKNEIQWSAYQDPQSYGTSTPLDKSSE